jgi:hypothetical protein
MRFQKLAPILIAGILILLFIGCPEKSTPPDDGTSWDIGTITNYTVSGGSGYEFAEAITGGTFIFPEGADGELSVAVINSGPTPPLSGSMFWIEYDGDEPVQLSLPMGDNDYLYLHGFGSSNGSFDDGIDADERWHALPIVNSAGGNIVFHLSMPFETSRFRPMRSSYRGFTHYQIAAIPSGSSRADTIAAAHAQALDLINHVLDSLPTAIQATARGSPRLRNMGGTAQAAVLPRRQLLQRILLLALPLAESITYDRPLSLHQRRLCRGCHRP